MTFQEQAKQLALNAQRIQAANKAAMRAIDKATPMSSAPSKRAPLAPSTIHDEALRNPLIAKLLRETQQKWMR